MPEDEAAQARRDRRWQQLQDRPPAGTGPIGELAGMLSPAQAYLVEEQRRRRRSGATLAVAGGPRLDVDLEAGTVTVHRAGPGPEAGSEADPAEP